ncbi:MAG: phenylacetate--CoA ligase family protein [Planctomycetota bacterium]|jgi:phenylacetate-CoA ligase
MADKPEIAPDEYWNPRNETMSREDLSALQVAKMKIHLEWAYERSGFHKRRFDAAGFSPDQFQSLADMARIPPMTRDEWMDAQAENPPYGDLPAAPPETAIRYHTTSGTTGRMPLRALDSMRDWEWIAEMWCYGFHAMGVRPSDTVFFAFSYGAFIGFWGAHYCCEKLGSLVIPSGSLPTETRIKLIIDNKATTVCSTPTYVLRMAEVAREMGIDVREQGSVEKIILSGEPSGSVPAVREKISEIWGAPCGDTAGMTEIGTIMCFECRHRPGGMHIIEDHFIEEVVDPETMEPVPYGERGERVVTSFGRGILPLIRYRTRDMVRRIPGSDCSCGRTFDIYDGGILGRVDDMHKIRGTNVYPRAVEAIVREHEQVDEFQIVLSRVEDKDEITVRIDMAESVLEHWPSIKKTLHNDLAEAHENLRFNVELADAGSLPRFELKAKRLVDNREYMKGRNE